MTYLNHAGTSWPKPPTVLAAVAEAMTASPTTWAQRFSDHHGVVAEALGTTREQLLLTPGCTSSLAVAMADIPWNRGDRLLISSMEHHALHRQAMLLRERGVELVVAPRATDGPIDVDFVEAEAKRGLRAIAISAACNVTGELTPVRALVDLARERGAISVVDAAQLAGWVLDLGGLGADMVAFTGHKGLQAPWGVGGLLFGEQVTLRSPRPRGRAPRPGWCDAGSVDRAALAGLVAGLAWLAEPARARRLTEGLALARALRAGLERIERVRLLGGPRRLPVVAVTVAGSRPSSLAKALSARGVVVSGGLQCAPLAHDTLGTGEGALRLSLGVSSTAEDVSAAVAALEDVLAAETRRQRRARRP